MKKCPRCDNIYDNTHNICLNCRLPLERIEESHLGLESKQTEDATKPIKKIIAEEGLVLLGFALVFFFGIIINGIGHSNYVASGIGALIALTSFGGYILYLFLYFFVWAITTLREK